MPMNSLQKANYMMMRLMVRVMPSCRDISQLISAGMDRNLPLRKRMTDTARRVTPAQIAALKNHFDDDGVVALTAWIAFQNLSAKFNSALGAEENGLCQLPGKPTGPG